MTNHKTRKSLTESPAFAVICTLAGVLTTGFLGWLGTHQAAKTNLELSCIARVDSKEKNLREKTSALMSSVGDLINYTVIPPSSKPEDLSKFTAPVLRSALEISAFAPEDLALIAWKIAANVQSASLASMGKADQEKTMAEISDSFGKWPSTYTKTLKSYESERKKCSE